MSGRGTYIVGKSQVYTTIQSAISALQYDQGSAAFTAEQRILISEDGSYPGFSIAQGTLTPTSSYRLIIGAVPGVKAVISGQADRTNNWTGVSSTSIDYLTVDNLIVRDFSRGGVFYGGRSLIVSNCVFRSNSILGLYVTGTSSSLICKNAISDSQTLMSLTYLTEPVIAHNSLVNYRAGRYCLYIEPLRTGGFITVSNYHRLFNNIISSVDVPIVIANGWERLLSLSDGNLFHTASDALVESRIDIGGVKTSKFIDTLSDWRRVSGGDANSSFEDPLFVKEKLSGYPTLDLIPDDHSTVGLRGVVLVDDPDDRLPSWVDDSIFISDASRHPFRSPPTPGCREMNPAEDFEFQGFFIDTSVIGTSDPSLDASLDGVARSHRQLEENLENSYPKISSGYFFHRDAKYYLYAKKRVLYLKDITWTELDLPTDLTDVSVIYGGEELEFTKRGQKIWVSHAGDEVGDHIEGHIKVSGSEMVWESSSQSFSYSDAIYNFLPSDGRQLYFLPSIPEQGAPVVITDDIVEKTDPRSIYPSQYTIGYSEELQKAEVTFEGASNLFENADFHYAEYSETFTSYPAPLGWEVGTSMARGPRILSETSGIDPFVGDNLLFIYETRPSTVLTQEIQKSDVALDNVLSFYLNSSSSGTLAVTVEGLDDERTVLGSVTSQIVLSPTIDQWIRYVLFLSASDLSSFDTINSTAYNVRLSDKSQIFDGILPTYLRVSIGTGTSARLYLDAFMISEGNVLKRFSRMPYGDGLTIEYEESESQLNEEKLISLNPILNAQSSGFLTITPVSASEFDTSAPEDTNTLTDWGWPVGRSIVPWAKIDGPNKLDFSVFDWSMGFTSSPIPREMNFTPEVPEPDEASISPSYIVVGQGYAVEFSATFRDIHSNPAAFKNAEIKVYDDEGLFPGYIGVRELGVPGLLGTEVETQTDPSGTVTATYISPSRDEIYYSGPKPLFQNWIPTKYEVNFENHGNIFISNATSEASYDLEGDEYSEHVFLTGDGGLSKAAMSKSPVLGSVRLMVSDTSSFDRPLVETFQSEVDRGQFYIDYSRNILVAHGSVLGEALVTYSPRLAWTDIAFPRRIYMETSEFPTMPDHIVVDYDARITLQVSMSMTDTSEEVWSEALVILRRVNG